MTILPTTMMATPYYLAQTSVTYSNDIVSSASAVIPAGYYIPYIQSVEDTQGYLEDPHELFKKIRTAVSSAYFDVSLTSQAKTKITYLGSGSGMLQFSNNGTNWATHFSPVLHALGFKPSSVVSNSFSFVSQGVSYVSDFSPFGAIFTNAKTNSSGWIKSNIFAGYTITPTGHVYGNKNSNDLYKQKFNLRFFPKNKETQASDTNFTALTPMYFKKWGSLFWKTPVGIGINQPDAQYDTIFLPEPYTVQQFLNQCPGQPIYCLFGNYQTCISASVNPGTDETYVLDVVYQTPESIKKQEQIKPSVQNFDKLYDVEDFEVAWLQSNQMILNSSSFQSDVWTPASLGNLTAWYRGDVVVYDGSNKVSQWTDKSGNGYHLLQSNASYKPTYVSSIAGKNSMPGVEAVSTGQYLQCANFVMSVAKTVVIVVGSFTAGAYVSSLYTGGIEYFYAYHPSIATFYNKDNVGGAHRVTCAGANFFQANTDHILMYDLTTPSLYRDNSSVGGTITGSPLTAGTKTGDLSLFSGWAGGAGSRMQILEVIIYSKALNSTERTQLDSYLTARYG